MAIAGREMADVLDIIRTRQRDACLEDASSETEFVPSRHHAARVVHTMISFLCKYDLEATVLRN